MDSLSLLHNSLNQRYSSTFNFYLSKDITDICQYRPHFGPSILFYQLLRLDCHDQMLKRIYHLVDSERVPLLAQYYAKGRLLPSESPLLFLTKGGNYVFKRIKRRLKRLRKQKEEQEDPFHDSNTFLKSLRTEDMGQQVYQRPNLLDNSMQTEAHDIYLVSRESSRMVSGPGSKQQHVFAPQQGSEIQPIPEYLIFDFKDRDIEKILSEYNSLGKQTRKQIPKGKAIKTRNSSISDKSATVSNRKKTVNTPRYKNSNRIVSNVRVSQQYFQGPNLQSAKYKKMVIINQGKIVRPNNPSQPRVKNYSAKSKNPQQNKYQTPKSTLPSPQTNKFQSKKGLTIRKSERVETQLSNKVKQKQLEAINAKAARLDKQAFKTLSKYRLRSVKSSEYIGGV